MQFPAQDWHRRFKEFPWNGAFCKDEQPQLWEYIAWFSSKVPNNFILFYFFIMVGNNNSNNNLQFHIILSSEASVLEFLSDFQHVRQAF